MSQNFSYRAVKSDGTVMKGTREAADKFALARELRAEGLTVTLLEPIKTRRHRNWREWFGSVKANDKIVFASSLSAMIGAGLSLSRALEVVRRQTANKHFQAVVAVIADQVNRGDSLSQALAAQPEIFPPVFVAMVGAGEESGNLSQSLEIVRQQLAKNYDLRRKIKGAMIYPAIILSVIVIIAILMMLFLVPSLTAIFKELKVPLPLSTRIIIAISDFLSQHSLAFILVLLLLIAAAVKWFRSAAGQKTVTRVIMHLPILKQIVHNLNAAVTMRTISSLIAAGVNMVEALEITEKVLQNFYYKEVMRSAIESVQKGGALSAVFKREEKIYPVLVGEMAEVGEETGNLSDMLLKGATFFEEDVDQATKNLSTIIEPVLMILIGLFVGLFAVSMLSPMYSLSNAI